MFSCEAAWVLAVRHRGWAEFGHQAGRCQEGRLDTLRRGTVMQKFAFNSSGQVGVGLSIPCL